MSLSEQGTQSQSDTKRIRSILVIQMGEVSEVFRSLMALKAIKHLYPEVQIHVMARRGCADPLKRVEWITSVIETPELASREQALPKTARWINQVLDQRYDILSNWTTAPKSIRMSAIATTLIPAVVKVGRYMREDFTIGSYDAWSMYQHAWMARPSIEQDIHYTDVITTQLLTVLQIHAGDPTQDSAGSAVTSRYFFKPASLELSPEWLARPKGLKWVAIHQESLHERASEWVQMVLRRNPDFGVLVLGSGLGFSDHARVIELKTALHFDSLLGILGQCAWLITGAHALSDLASLINLRVFYNAEPASVVPFNLKWTETGPYGNGHVVYVPKEEWQPEMAYAIWSYYQSEWFHKNSLTLHGHFENLGLASQADELQAYKSRIRSSTEGGGVSYELTLGAKQEFESWMFRVRGQMARAWFCGWLPSIEEEAKKIPLTPNLIRRIRQLQESTQVAKSLVEQGRVTGVRLKELSAQQRSDRLMSVEDRDAIEEAGRKLLEVESLFARVIEVEPSLHSLLAMYQEFIHNLRSETLLGMTEETLHAFDLVLEGIALINAYTERTLSLAKPKAVELNTKPLSELKPV